MFDEFLAGLADDQRQVLVPLIEQVVALAPDAEEGRSYGAPAFRYRGKPLLGFTARPAYLTLFPFSPEVLEAAAPHLEGFTRSKGAVRFTPQQPPPEDAVAELVTGRMREIDGA